ncbi:hypothetical protein [Nocardia cyriacigeorgica]|uniref:hypothetical protein n=1 Tax=Nocardia cyriacigeorgica TaxID=135487 RepID=UPI00245643AD|nr:hypothetical protein [Nocardia cyriacigeorgica]
MPDPIRASDYDPDFSHAMLVAVLMKLGGSVTLTADDLTHDALGDTEGRLYPLTMTPTPDGRGMVLAVAPTTITEKSP